MGLIILKIYLAYRAFIKNIEMKKRDIKILEKATRALNRKLKGIKELEPSRFQHRQHKKSFIYSYQQKIH